MLSLSTCSACGSVFTSTSTVDLHRVGEYSVPIYGKRKKLLGHRHTRRCLTPKEMRETGLVKNASGQWGVGLTAAHKHPKAS